MLWALRSPLLSRASCYKSRNFQSFYNYSTIRLKTKMGQLVKGKWTVSDEPTEATAYHRKLGSEQFPFDKSTPSGRYHLYLSKSCPYAQRTDIALRLKKLDDRIGTSFVNPRNTTEGWTFDPQEFSGIGDKVNGLKLLQEVYTKADSEYTGRVTVPLLIDTQTGLIVSNESAEIVQAFGELSNEGPNILEHASQQEKVAPWLGEFTGGIFKTGRAKTQADYDQGVDNFYKVIERYEKHLSTSNFLAGDSITAVDVNSFPLFIRFDTVFSILFQISRAKLSDFPNFDKYIRRVYQQPGVKETTDVEHIMKGNFGEITQRKFLATDREFIVPAAPVLNWDKPL